jgi:hypothetical protein
MGIFSLHSVNGGILSCQAGVRCSFHEAWMRCIGGFELLCSHSPFEPAVSVEGGLDK